MILNGSQVLARIFEFCQPDFINAKNLLRKALARRKKRISEALNRFQKELNAALTWKTIEQEAHLLQANFASIRRGLKSIELADWEDPSRLLIINLDPVLNPQDNIAAFFRKAKKYRKGIPHLEKMVLETAKQLETFDSLQISLENAKTIGELKTIRVSANLPERQTLPVQRGNAKEIKPYIEFISSAGIPIWVGRNARCNDKLTFQYAHGLDTWLHVVGYPGSHVVIRMPKGEDPDAQTLQDALQLALQYSKAKNCGEAEVCITQRKYVSRLGQNQPGKVQVSRQKTLLVKLDKNRLACPSSLKR